MMNCMIIVNDKLEVIHKEAVVAWFEEIPLICMNRLRKTMKTSVSSYESYTWYLSNIKQ
jgi:hypothetical protein